MKIILTGGGSGGHFYPLIAIAEQINALADERKLLQPTLYYMSTAPYNQKLLDDNNITFKSVTAGKRRLYSSSRNFLDIFKMAFGIFKAFWTVFSLYPDIIISKGGYASVPATFAGWILRIPIIVHESDSAPGRANIWAGKFARRVAVSWPEAAASFAAEKVAVTGQPVRKDMTMPVTHGAYEYLKLEENVPVILILGGSQGSQKINEAILTVLPELVSRYQIIHQVGLENIESIQQTYGTILGESEYKHRYKPFGYLNPLAQRMAAGISSIVVSRAGSTIFEIATWGLPSILIPITDSHGDHQRRNAFNYARSGGGIVIAEKNLTPHVLLAEIDRLYNDQSLRTQMSQSAKSFFIPDAARQIADRSIAIALRHED